MPVSPLTSRAAGIVLGMAIDAAVGDPRRGHPVAGFGSWAGWVEKRTYGDTRLAGAVHLAVAVVPVVLTGGVVERAARARPAVHVVVAAMATWACVGARTLALEGRLMADALDAGSCAAGSLDAARDRLPHLCGRDPAGLDEPELARATVESLAENTADAVLAPLWWGALLGVPGLLAHRAINTLDAMVGHRSPRYARFGTASARADDVSAWLPARATGLLACALAPLVGGDAAGAWRAMRRDHAAHPSPNGGWCEAAWAGALGVQLGGRNRYAHRVEDRPLLGSGPRPGAHDVRRAARLVTIVSWVATALTGAALSSASSAGAALTSGRAGAALLSVRGTR